MPKKKPYTVDWEKLVPITLRNLYGKEFATVEGHLLTIDGLMEAVVHKMGFWAKPEFWRVSDPITGRRVTLWQGKDPKLLVGKVVAQLLKDGRTREKVEEAQLAALERFTTL